MNRLLFSKMSFVSLSSSIEETSIMELTEVVQITFVAFFAIIVYFMSPPTNWHIMNLQQITPPYFV